MKENCDNNIQCAYLEAYKRIRWPCGPSKMLVTGERQWNTKAAALESRRYWRHINQTWEWESSFSIFVRVPSPCLSLRSSKFLGILSPICAPQKHILKRCWRKGKQKWRVTKTHARRCVTMNEAKLWSKCAKKIDFFGIIAEMTVAWNTTVTEAALSDCFYNHYDETFESGESSSAATCGGVTNFNGQSRNVFISGI